MHRLTRAGRVLGAAMAAAALAFPALAQNDDPVQKPDLVRAFSIWDLKLGAAVASIPEMDVVEVACGTNGGPPSVALAHFSDYAKCVAEPSGLREIHFSYDDEADYIAKALESEYRALQPGTSVYAHPVVLSVLVDDKGIIEGYRIITDDKAAEHDRRAAVSLASNFKARFSAWKLDCQKIAPRDGENPVGSIFIHDLCTATSIDKTQLLRLESSYLRKKGEGVNPDTQLIDKSFYQSTTRLEVVQVPFQPAPAPRG